MNAENLSPVTPSRHDWHTRRHSPPGIVAGLFVITLGGLLLCRELGMLPEGVRVWDFWPLFLVAFGLSHLGRGRGLVSMALSLIIALFGVGLLLENLGVIAFGVAHLWPVVIVALGFAMVWHALTRQSRHARTLVSVSADELRRSVAMGGAQIKIESQQFKGGEVSAVMAGVEIDLRGAKLATDEVKLDLDCVMSGIELRVPPTWQVVTNIAPVLGAVEDNTPPVPEGTTSRPRLVLSGSIIMGAINIKH